MEKYLNLVTEYQKAKTAENIMRTAPLPRPSSLVAEEAQAALLKVING